MIKRLALVFAVIALSSTAVMSECADENDSGYVMMGGYMLFRMRCPSPGLTLQQRTDIIQARVNDLLNLEGFDINSIHVEKAGNDAILYANGKVLVTVDPQTAKLNKTTPEGLARVWAQRLRDIYPKAAPRPETAPSENQ